MYVATSKQMKAYDQALLKEGYKIEELVDKASDVILPHCRNYDKIVIVCGPGNNGADGLSLGIKLHLRARKVKLYCFGNPNKLSKALLPGGRRPGAGRAGAGPLPHPPHPDQRGGLYPGVLSAGKGQHLLPLSATGVTAPPRPRP